MKPVHAYRFLLIGLLGLIFFPITLRSQGGLRGGESDVVAWNSVQPYFLSQDEGQREAEKISLNSIRSQIQAMPVEDLRLRELFDWLRDTYFKEYAAVATLGETLREGKFNCVSSTALTAFVLGEAGIPFRIEETPRHVLLYALQNGRWLRVETTSDERAIFRSPRKEEAWTRDIGLDQLAALQSYNSGLLALDESRSTEAYQHFFQAQQLYPDVRIFEMLEHAAEKEARLGLRLVRKNQLAEARIHLENALQLQPGDKLLQKALAASVLLDIESRDDHAENLRALEAAMQKHAFLQELVAVRQVHSDLILAVAWEHFDRDENARGLALLHEFEQKYATAADLVQASMAGEVYSKAWKALVRAGDEKSAAALLQRGLIFAPQSSNLARKRDAMAMGGMR